MKQAKTLTAAELRRVTDSIATRAHPVRNRAMLMMTHLAGLRVGEVAQLAWADVVTAEGAVREEVRLNADQTKGSPSRSLYLASSCKSMATRLACSSTDLRVLALYQLPDSRLNLYCHIRLSLRLKRINSPSRNR